MIPFEDLCAALEEYRHRRETGQLSDATSEPLPATPDVTAETTLPRSEPTGDIDIDDLV